jgi:hypothetical protein
MKMQEVEWFAARAPQVALQERASDRKAVIEQMKNAGDPLIQSYERASAIAERAMTLARRGGDYPLLSRGDINVYSLFVERAQRLIKPDGIAGASGSIRYSQRPWLRSIHEKCHRGATFHSWHRLLQ